MLSPTAVFNEFGCFSSDTEIDLVEHQLFGFVDNKFQQRDYLTILTRISFLLFQIYLSQYGYLSAKARNPTSGGNLLAQDSWETAIREFQGFAGLNITGKQL